MITLSRGSWSRMRGCLRAWRTSIVLFSRERGHRRCMVQRRRLLLVEVVVVEEVIQLLYHHYRRHRPLPRSHHRFPPKISSHQQLYTPSQSKNGTFLIGVSAATASIVLLTTIRPLPLHLVHLLPLPLLPYQHMMTILPSTTISAATTTATPSTITTETEP